jgi:hypothetical protein
VRGDDVHGFAGVEHGGGEGGAEQRLDERRYVRVEAAQLGAGGARRLRVFEACAQTGVTDDCVDEPRRER